jgi:hypothetical protein
MKPALAFSVIVVTVNVLVQNMRIVSAKPRGFLFNAYTHMIHELFVTAIPEFAITLDRSPDAVACGFDHVLAHDFAVQRGQFPVPVHRFHLRPGLRVFSSHGVAASAIISKTMEGGSGA